MGVEKGEAPLFQLTCLSLHPAMMGEECKQLLVWGANEEWYAVQTHSRLLLRVGIKVADEWQISLGYVRGSNIYVRGYLDLRAWSLILRA